MSSSTDQSETILVPEKFPSTIVDFVNDLTATFPEYADKWSKYIVPSSESSNQIFNALFAHCLTVFPERFFDILNQNAKIFEAGSEVNTFFLPEVDFKVLYHCAGVSENTRQVIWKYLQVILFMLVGSVKDKSDFGDAMNMFDGLEEGDLADKMKTVMSGISDFFGQMEKGNENSETSKNLEEGEDENIGEEDMGNAFKKAFSFMEGLGEDQNGSSDHSSSSPSSSPNLPKPEDLNDHLKNLFNGKIGTLAKELAEDIGQDLAGAFGEDMQNIKSTKDVFAKLMQNPQKISGLVKTVGEKLNQKMASGDISRDDLMGEAGDLMRKMKEMGGGENFAEMFKNMAKGMGMNIPKGAKFDQNAMNQMEKKMTMRDKLKQRMEQKQAQKAATEMAEQAKMKKQYEDYARFMAANPDIAKAAENFTLANTQDANHKVFSIKGGETQEKTLVNPNGTNAMTTETGEGPAKLTAGQKKKAKAKAKKQAAKQVEDNAI